jgi:uncharacterized metal-binding protein YceD (DUF177 family)
MKNNREFEIAFVGLKPGEHIYHYTIADNFFDNLVQAGKIEQPEFKDTNAEVKLILDKKSTTLFLKFFINGKVTLPCDRCGDDYEMTIWEEFELLVKIVDDEMVEKLNLDDAEVAYIGRSESLLEVSNWIFEFVTLCIPIQHVHGEDEQGNSLCNPEALKFLENQPNQGTAAIWDQLKNNKQS